MGFGYIIDQFHNQYGFSYTGTAKKTNFTTFGVRCQKVYDLWVKLYISLPNLNINEY